MYVRRVRSIGVGMLGYAFMGKAHANAYRKLAYMTWPPPLLPRLVSISGRSAGAEAALRVRVALDRLARDRRRLAAIAAGREVGPHGAGFEDGYRAAEVCDAISRSGASGAREPIAYRSL